MIDGPDYEGRTRECETCGHFTNVHYLCEVCNKPICDKCDYHGDRKHYCSYECFYEACESAVCACGLELSDEGLCNRCDMACPDLRRRLRTARKEGRITMVSVCSSIEIINSALRSASRTWRLVCAGQRKCWRSVVEFPA